METKRQLHHVEISDSEIYIDGKQIRHVKDVYVDYPKDSVPEMTITVESVLDIDDMMYVEVAFGGESLEEFLRYLAFACRVDDGFKQTCIDRINEVLDGEQYGSDAIASAILDKLFGGE